MALKGTVQAEDPDQDPIEQISLEVASVRFVWQCIHGGTLQKK
jgi:hypothetical protein